MLEQLEEKMMMPEDEADLARKENELRDHFDAKAKQFENEKANLNEILEGFGARRENLKESEASERERLVIVTQKMQSTREGFVKSTNRTGKDIESLDKRMIEAQEITYAKMERTWKKEQIRVDEWICNEQEETERMIAAHQRRQPRSRLKHGGGSQMSRGSGGHHWRSRRNRSAVKRRPNWML